MIFLYKGIISRIHSQILGIRLLNCIWKRGLYPQNQELEFIHRVGEAVERIMGLYHDPIRLKSELGTNLGELVMGMRLARTG